jgi:hypothetical protein
VRHAGHELDLVTMRSVLGWEGDWWRSGGLGAEVTVDRALGAPGETPGKERRGQSSLRDLALVRQRREAA